MPTSSQMRCLQNHGYIYPASGRNDRPKQTPAAPSQIKPSALQQQTNAKAMDAAKKASVQKEMARQIRSVQKPQVDVVPQPKNGIPYSRVLTKGVSLARVLQAQKNILNMALSSLKQWNEKDQSIFKAIFSSVDKQEQANISTSLEKLLDLNQHYQSHFEKHNDYEIFNKEMQQQSLSPDQSLKALFPKSKIKEYTYCMLVYEYQLSSLQERLEKRIEFLKAAKTQLERWSAPDRDRFALVFGSASINKRAEVYDRIDKMLRKYEARIANDNNSHKLIDLRMPEFPKLEKMLYKKYCDLAYVSRHSQH